MTTTKIEWCDRVWNPVTGCTPVSEGCANCYAKRFAGRHMGIWGDQSDASNPERGFRDFSDVRCHPERLDAPLHWRKPLRIFVNSMSDLFHGDVPDSFIDQVVCAMGLNYRPTGEMKRISELSSVAVCKQRHIYMILTKRSDRMADYWRKLMEMDPEECRKRLWKPAKDLAEKTGSVPPFSFNASLEVLQWLAEGTPGLWMGVTIENQEQADKRRPAMESLYASGFRNLFVSYEPALSAVDWTPWMPIIRWIVAGGETGPGARPSHPEWFRSLRDQCQVAGVPFFFKGWGEWGTNWARIGTDEPVYKYFADEQQWIQKAQGWVRKSNTCLSLDGRVCRIGKDFSECRYPVVILSRVGKAQAGRDLDGRTWEDLPWNTK